VLCCTQIEAEELPWQVDLQQLADAVVNLVRHGWPPSMVLLYDEVGAAVCRALYAAAFVCFLISPVNQEPHGSSSCS
jgi:hypothetical protein